jgi:hypothetical protein
MLTRWLAKHHGHVEVAANWQPYSRDYCDEVSLKSEWFGAWKLGCVTSEAGFTSCEAGKPSTFAFDHCYIDKG